MYRHGFCSNIFGGFGLHTNFTDYAIKICIGFFFFLKEIHFDFSWYIMITNANRTGLIYYKSTRGAMLKIISCLLDLMNTNMSVGSAQFKS